MLQQIPNSRDIDQPLTSKGHSFLRQKLMFSRSKNDQQWANSLGKPRFFGHVHRSVFCKSIASTIPFFPFENGINHHCIWVVYDISLLFVERTHQQNTLKKVWLPWDFHQPLVNQPYFQHITKVVADYHWIHSETYLVVEMVNAHQNLSAGTSQRKVLNMSTSIGASRQQNGSLMFIQPIMKHHGYQKLPRM